MHVCVCVCVARFVYSNDAFIDNYSGNKNIGESVNGTKKMKDKPHFCF